MIPSEKYPLFRFVKFNFKLLRRILTVAFPMMLQNFISLSGWFVFFVFVESMGERPLAISNIIRSIYVVLMIPIWGFASATNTLVSNLIGQNKKHEVIPVTVKIVKMCFTAVVFVVSLSLIFPRQVLSLYTENQNLIQDTIPVYYVVAGAAVFFSIAFILFSAVSGTGKTVHSLIIEIAVIFFYLTCTYCIVYVLDYSIEFVWSVEYFYAFVLGIISMFYLRKGNWKYGNI